MITLLKILLFFIGSFTMFGLFVDLDIGAIWFEIDVFVVDGFILVMAHVSNFLDVYAQDLTTIFVLASGYLSLFFLTHVLIGLPMYERRAQERDRQEKKARKVAMIVEDLGKKRTTLEALSVRFDTQLLVLRRREADEEHLRNASEVLKSFDQLYSHDPLEQKAFELGLSSSDDLSDLQIEDIFAQEMQKTTPCLEATG